MGRSLWPPPPLECVRRPSRLRGEAPRMRAEAPRMRTFFSPHIFFAGLFFSAKSGLNFEILPQKNEIRLDLGAGRPFSAVFRSISALIGL